MATLHDLLKVLSQPAECLVQYLDLIEKECGGSDSAPVRNTYVQAQSQCIDFHKQPALMTVVTAPPGGGKTVYLTRIAALIARTSRERIKRSQCKFEDAWIPFFIPATVALHSIVVSPSGIAKTQLEVLPLFHDGGAKLKELLIAALQDSKRKKIIIIETDHLLKLPDGLLKRLKNSGSRILISFREDTWESIAAEACKQGIAAEADRKVALLPFDRSRQKKLTEKLAPTTWRRIQAVCGPSAAPYAVVAIAKSNQCRPYAYLSVPELFRELAGGNHEDFEHAVAKTMFRMFLEGRTPRKAEFTRVVFVECTARKDPSLWNEACALGVFVRAVGKGQAKSDRYYTTTDQRFIPWLLACGFVADEKPELIIKKAKKLLKRDATYWRQMLFDYLPSVLKSEERTAKLAGEWRKILTSHGKMSIWRRVFAFFKR